MVYLFTNHQNLLQAATKGYLSPFIHWKRYKADFAEDVQSNMDRQLVFGEKPLPYTYNYETDKSLHGVAIGIQENILKGLGYTQENGFWVGTAPILFPLIGDIIFETAEGPRILKSRHEEYFALLGRDLFPTKASLFRKTEGEIILEFAEKPEVQTQERRLNRAFGGFGHLLEDLVDVGAHQYLLAMVLLQTHHEGAGVPIDYEKMQTFAQSILSNWTLSESKLQLLNHLLCYTKRGLTPDTKIAGSVSKRGSDRIFNLLECLDIVLNDVEKTISTMDRKAFIEAIAICYKNNKKADPVIMDTLGKILRVYDYDYTVEELIQDIQEQPDSVLREFLLGLEFFSRDPIDPKNISQLKAAIEYPQEHTTFAVALFLWGRTHGAFSIEPNKKLKMLRLIGVKNFYALCVSGYPMNLVDDKIQLPKPPKENNSVQSYNGIAFWKEEGMTEDCYDYLEYSHRLTNSGGLNLESKHRDYFEDVTEYMKKLRSGKVTLTAVQIRMIFDSWIPLLMHFDVGGAEYDFEYASFDIDKLDLSMKEASRPTKTTPEMTFHLQLDSLKAWAKFIAEELYHRSQSASMRQEIRQRLLQDLPPVPMPEDQVVQIGKSDEIRQEIKKESTQKELPPSPTMNDSRDTILAYFKVHNIPLPEKRTKSVLIEAIKNINQGSFGF